MNSSIHRALKSWNNTVNWPYLSSLMIVNKDIPYFRDNKHDYEWMLEVTENRKCKEVEPSVVRYENGNNLSLDAAYRLEDFEIASRILLKQGNSEVVLRLRQTLARYFYKMGRYKEAREHFSLCKPTAKNVGYYFTSYCPALARLIVKKYNVFG